MPLVMCLGHWRELDSAVEVYRCRLCRGAVILGDTGKAISQPDGTWLYEHYDKCVPDAPVKPRKKARKKVTK